MAEPISFTLAAVGLVDVCTRLIVWLKDVQKQSERVDADVKDLADEIQTIHNVGDSVHSTAQDVGDGGYLLTGQDQDEVSKTLSNHWQNVQIALSDCENVIMQLESLLKDVIGKGRLERTSKRLDGLVIALRKNSKEKDYMRIRQRLSSSQNALQSCLQALSMTYNHYSQKNVDSRLKQAINYLEEIKTSTEQKTQLANSVPALSREAKNTILRWLKFSDSSTFYNDARQKHTGATGDWFLNGEFKAWTKTLNSFIWLSGKAGCGKTILSSTVINEVDNQHLGTLAYFFFSFRRTESQGLRNFLQSILTQIVQGLTRKDDNSPELFYVPRAFQELYDNTLVGSEPKIESLKNTLMAVLEESPATYIIVDALDECPIRKDRFEILNFLMELSLSPSRRTHILVTSRREEDIVSLVEKLSVSCPIITMPLQNPEVAQDIQTHVQYCVQDNYDYASWTPKLKNTVIEDLTKRADGVFRWAECQLATLRLKLREEEVLTALKELPKDLDETYARMLSQISATGYANECRAVFQWLAFSRRPLLLAEAAEAAIFVYDGTSTSQASGCLSYNPKKRFQNPLDIRSILSQLVTVSGRDLNPASSHEDKPTSGVEISFSHFSVQEYLMCDRVDLNFKIDAALAHRFILESCIVYILHCYSVSPDFLSLDHGAYPLLQYACQFWPIHADHARSAISETSHINDSILQVFREKGVRFVETLKVVSSLQKPAQRFFISDDEFASPAWYLSYLRSVYPLKLLKRDESIDPCLESSFRGLSALHVAAEGGSEAVVSTLLDLGANLSALDEKQRTALHCAAAVGHDLVVQFLVDKGSAITALDEDEETALHRAVREGRENTVHLLAHWNKGVALKMKDAYGLTPLHLALRVSEWLGPTGEEITNILLKAGASLETSTWSGLTALEEVSRYRGYGENAFNLSNIPKFATPVSQMLPVRKAMSKAIWSQSRSLGVSIYSDAYTYVHDFCTAQKEGIENTRRVTRAQPHQDRGAQLLGEALYWDINDYLREQMTELRASAAQKNEADLLCFYWREWTRFTFASSQINRVCAFLNRHWIKREIDEGKAGRYLVYDLGLVRWCHDLVQREPRITQYVLKNMEKHRDGESIDITTTGSILLRSFTELDNRFEAYGDNGAQLYHKAFEEPFLERTKALYYAKSRELRRVADISTYIHEAEALLDEQITRLRDHVKTETIYKIAETAVNVFVQEFLTDLCLYVEKLSDDQLKSCLTSAENLLKRSQSDSLFEQEKVESIHELYRQKKEELLRKIELRDKKE